MVKQNKMFYLEDTLGKYTDYGILVPLKDNRVEKALEAFGDSDKIVSSKQGVLKLEDILFAHEKSYLDKVKSDPTKVVQDAYELIDEDGKPNRYDPDNATRELKDFITKALTHCEGTYLAAQYCLESGFAYHLGGGMHHSKSFGPSGFCIFNDIVIAIRKLISEKRITNALVIDLDAHKGDGTAQITEGDDNITTVSIHMKNGWPLDNPDKSDPCYIPSNLDIPVELTDDYLKELAQVESILDKNYDLCIVVHGGDVFVDDVLESAKGIQLSLDDCLKRDMYIHNLLKSKNIPQAWCMGGGYGSEVYKVFLQFLKEVF